MDGELAACFRETHARLVGLAFLLCGDHAAAEDAVVEAFAKTLPRWRRGLVRDLPAYVRQAVVNEVMSHHRRRRWFADAPVGDVADGIDADRADDDAAFRATLDRDALLPALRSLPPGQRAVLVLRHYLDVSEREVAEMLGIDEGTVKSQASKARAALRQRLEEDDR